MGTRGNGRVRSGGGPGRGRAEGAVRASSWARSGLAPRRIRGCARAVVAEGHTSLRPSGPLARDSKTERRMPSGRSCHPSNPSAGSRGVCRRQRCARRVAPSLTESSACEGSASASARRRRLLASASPSSAASPEAFTTMARAPESGLAISAQRGVRAGARESRRWKLVSASTRRSTRALPKPRMDTLCAVRRGLYQHPIRARARSPTVRVCHVDDRAPRARRRAREPPRVRPAA